MKDDDYALAFGVTACALIILWTLLVTLCGSELYALLNS